MTKSVKKKKNHKTNEHSITEIELNDWKEGKVFLKISNTKQWQLIVIIRLEFVIIFIDKIVGLFSPTSHSDNLLSASKNSAQIS